MGTGASRLVGGSAQGAHLADKGGGDAAAAAAAGANADDDRARLPTTATTKLSEEDRASAAAAAAVACAFGLENFGNTCYCNSVLQALYYCRPFRDRLLEHHAATRERGNDDSLLDALGDLFSQAHAASEAAAARAAGAGSSGSSSAAAAAANSSSTSGGGGGAASSAANAVASAASSFLPSLLAGAAGRASALTSAVGGGGGGGAAGGGMMSSSGANNFGGGSRRGAVLAPKRFVQKLKRDNEAFRSFMHQDAHEFLNYLLNDCVETLQREARERAEAAAEQVEKAAAGGALSPPPPPPAARRGLLLWGRGGGGGGAAAAANAAASPAASPSPRKAAAAAAAPPSSPAASARASPEKEAATAAAAGGGGSDEKPLQSSSGSEPAVTWIDDVFRGTLVSETRCLSCEACSQRSEPFYDLSLEVAPDTSLTGCLRTFSKVETLGGEDKLRCESCGVLQEAQKRLRVLALPKVLCLHLKRFKYLGAEGGGNNGNGYYGAAPRMRKLGHRVAFPRELKLGPVVASAACPDADATLRLSAVVVHVGAGASHGHYVAFVRVHKSGGKKKKKMEKEGASSEAAKEKKKKKKELEKTAAAAASLAPHVDEESSEGEADRMEEHGRSSSRSSRGESDRSDGTESGSDDDSSSSDSDSDSPWLLLDDDAVERAAPGALAATFGATRGGSFGGVDHGYILMYERCD